MCKYFYASLLWRGEKGWREGRSIHLSSLHVKISDDISTSFWISLLKMSRTFMERKKNESLGKNSTKFDLQSIETRRHPPTFPLNKSAHTAGILTSRSCFRPIPPPPPLPVNFKCVIRACFARNEVSRDAITIFFFSLCVSVSGLCKFEIFLKIIKWRNEIKICLPDIYN